MTTERRLLGLLVVAAVAAAPALLLRTLCVGRACLDPAPERAEVPFCSLPGDLRRRLAAGYRDGRSPDVLAVTGPFPVAGTTAGATPPSPWPSIDPETAEAGRVPLVFHGAAVAGGARVPAGTRLDRVAPTVAEMLRFDRPHPEVRSGTAVEGVAGGEPPRLVLTVVWKGAGTADLEAAPGRWPFLRRLLRQGAGTMEARVGSLPLDPAAVLTTLGTGGLPRQHGITGTLIRTDEGEMVEAWGRGAPTSVIATLGDDLDEHLDQRPRVGLVASHRSERGAIGGNWYVETDRDDLRIVRGGPGTAVEAGEDLLASGYGQDRVPDLLTVVLEGPVRAMDDATRRLADAAAEAGGGSATLVVTSSGSVRGAVGAVSARQLERRVETAVGTDAIEGATVGGIFVDQEGIALGTVTEDDVIGALRRLEAPGEGRLFRDVFPGIAVALGRYC